MALLSHQVVPFSLENALVSSQKGHVAAGCGVVGSALTAQVVDFGEVVTELLGAAGVVRWKLLTQQHFGHLR